jgi:hypothetical protein
LGIFFQSENCFTRVRLCQGFGATVPKAFGTGGKGIRTPDFQLAKLALYQLSYAPERTGESRLLILDCKSESEIENRDPKLKKMPVPQKRDRRVSWLGQAKTELCVTRGSLKPWFLSIPRA